MSQKVIFQPPTYWIADLCAQRNHSGPETRQIEFRGLRFQIRAACLSVEMPRTGRMDCHIGVLSCAPRWAIWIGGAVENTFGNVKMRNDERRMEELGDKTQRASDWLALEVFVCGNAMP